MPFGDVEMVRDWRFFARFFVANYCPLAFIEASGRNFTPDKLPANERARYSPRAIARWPQSPASPVANRGWAEQMTRALEAIGIRC